MFGDSWNVLSMSLSLKTCPTLWSCLMRSINGSLLIRVILLILLPSAARNAKPHPGLSPCLNVRQLCLLMSLQSSWLLGQASVQRMRLRCPRHHVVQAPADLREVRPV